MSCKHLYQVTEVVRTLEGATHSGARYCRLKDNPQERDRMNLSQSSQVGDSMIAIGHKCPFVDDGSFAQCDWFAS